MKLNNLLWLFMLVAVRGMESDRSNTQQQDAQMTTSEKAVIAAECVGAGAAGAWICTHASILACLCALPPAGPIIAGTIGAVGGIAAVYLVNRERKEHSQRIQRISQRIAPRISQRERNRGETEEVVHETLLVESAFVLERRTFSEGHEMCFGWCLFATSPAKLDDIQMCQTNGECKITIPGGELFTYTRAATRCSNYELLRRGTPPNPTTGVPHSICPNYVPTTNIGVAPWLPSHANQTLGRRLDVDEPNPYVCSPNEICSKRDAARRLSSNDDGTGSSANEKSNKIRFTQMYNAGAASDSDDAKRNKHAVEKKGDFLMKASIGKADGDYYGAKDQADGTYGMALLIQFDKLDGNTEVTKELLTEKAKGANGAQKTKVGAWINSIFTNKHQGAKAGDAGTALIKLIQTEIAAGSTNVLLTIGSTGDGYGAWSAKTDLSEAHNRFTTDGGQTAGDARAVLNLA